MRRAAWIDYVALPQWYGSSQKNIFASEALQKFTHSLFLCTDVNPFCHVMTLSLNLIMEFMLAATISTLLIFLFGYWIRRRRLEGADLPPGPLCLPIVGTMLSGDLKDLPKTMAKWARQYGSVFTSYIGPYRVVVLSSPAVVKEAFSKDVFVPRPMLWSAMERSKMNNNATGLGTVYLYPGFWDNLETKSIR